MPAGTAAGDWDVVVTDDACSASLPAGLRVTGTLTVDVSGVDPPFGWTGERTAVTIRSALPPGAGLENFHPTPRAYLNPTAGGGALASELRAVAYLDANRLTGVVPAGLAVGAYDLIIVNPDGHVGVRPGAYRVTVDRPPEVVTLTPGSVPNQVGQTVTVVGQDFRAPALVTATCRTPAGAATTVTPVSPRKRRSSSRFL